MVASPITMCGKFGAQKWAAPISVANQQSLVLAAQALPTAFNTSLIVRTRRERRKWLYLLVPKMSMP